MPIIFVNESGLCFVKLCRRRWEESRVRHLVRSEALRFADLYGIQDLRAALSRAEVGTAS
jgi:hypothetical protein